MPEITVFADGPYLIDAEGLTLKDQDGNTIPLGKGNQAALCRCGQSENKPFCDGTHKRIEFKHTPKT
jgi:CDGSH-type Zn-finger protein